GTATYTAATGVWTITGTVARSEERRVGKECVPASNNDVNTTITTHIVDAANTGPTDGVIDLNVTAVNDAPTATNLSQTLGYTEGAASVAINDIVVTVPVTGDSSTATSTRAKTADVSLTARGTATYTAATGVWTITGTVA